MQVFDNRMSVIVPDQFGLMNEEAAKQKNPSAHRPQCILTNDDGSVNIAFSLLDFMLEYDQIEKQVSEWKMVMMQANSTYVFLSERIEVMANYS